MWEAISYVSSGFTLTAFIVAATAWVVKAKSEQKARLISLADTETKAKLVQDALDFFHVSTEHLKKDQQFDLAVQQIRSRASRFKTISILIGFLSALAAVLSAYAIDKVSTYNNKYDNAQVLFNKKSIQTSESEYFEKLVSQDADINEIIEFIARHTSILNGVPQIRHGSSITEDVQNFPITEGLIPHFTRFNFMPTIQQVHDSIIFIDLLPPSLYIFESEEILAEEVTKRVALMQRYRSTGSESYYDYVLSAARLSDFSIPLSRMQEYIDFPDNFFSTSLSGVIIVGKRNTLSRKQIGFLSTFNKESHIKIITYDTLLE